MDSLYGPYAPHENRLALRLLAGVAIVVSAAALAAVVMLPAGEHEGAEGVHSPVLGVSRLVYRATPTAEWPQPGGEQWTFPAAAVEAGGDTYVLDTGNNRILKLDTAGNVTGVLGSGQGDMPLRDPMAMATDGALLYIANSAASQVLVMDLRGGVQKVLRLPQAPGDALPTRPIGIAVLPGGGLAVSDAANHRVLFLDGEGNVVRSVGTGTRSGGQEGFNVPGALATDSTGNVYVVDTLNGRVMKLSPDGAYAGEFGRLGDTAGSLSRPKGVAVDAAGRVFVSDGLLAAVEVFGPNREYLGVIGRKHPDDAASGSLFKAPAGLWLSGNRLTVVDRMGGLITLELPASSRTP